MTGNAIDLRTYQALAALRADGLVAIDGTRHRRYSCDPARRGWYARHHAARFARWIHGNR